jgi:hypothetical protein
MQKRATTPANEAERFCLAAGACARETHRGVGEVNGPTCNRAIVIHHKNEERNMNMKTIVLAAMLALSAGVGVGFSTNSYAVDPVCRGDCADDRQGCNFGCLGSSACQQACYNAYQACLAACRV